MTDDFNRKLGVWRIIYDHVPVRGKYNNMPTPEQVLELSIEMQLELGMLAEANRAIAAIKGKLD